MNTPESEVDDVDCIITTATIAMTTIHASVAMSRAISAPREARSRGPGRYEMPWFGVDDHLFGVTLKALEANAETDSPVLCRWITGRNNTSPLCHTSLFNTTPPHTHDTHAYAIPIHPFSRQAETTSQTWLKMAEDRLLMTAAHNCSSDAPHQDRRSAFHSALRTLVCHNPLQLS
jgi:hypothetical protein